MTSSNITVLIVLKSFNRLFKKFFFVHPAYTSMNRPDTLFRNYDKKQHLKAVCLSTLFLFYEFLQILIFCRLGPRNIHKLIHEWFTIADKASCSHRLEYVNYAQISQAIFLHVLRDLEMQNQNRYTFLDNETKQNTPLAWLFESRL